MPRHVPDDFSFLPSVDSTDEEVIERRSSWREKKSVPREEPPDQPPPQVKAPTLPFIAPPAPLPKQHLPNLAGADAFPTPRSPRVLRLATERTTRTIETPQVSSGNDRDRFEWADSKRSHIPKRPPEEPDDPETAKHERWRKLAEKVGIQSLGWSLGVHLFILITATFIGVKQVMDRQVDFLPSGRSAQGEAAAAELTHKIQQKKNPWLKSKPRLQAQTLNTAVTLPEMPQLDMPDFSKINDRMDLSSARGALGLGQPLGMGAGGSGGGFGSGIGRGGKFSFVGQTALGKRVVFVVDVSGSMSAIKNGESISRFDLLKKELTKSLNQMPMGTQYQILFFSDFAWPHDQVDSRNIEALMKYRWDIDTTNYKRVKIPTFRYVPATPFSLPESVKIVQNSDNPGGTNWGSGLLMALNANPKPDVIFFMTDGLRSDEQGWIDIVTDENKRRLPMTAIYTSAMQEPDAARELDALAKRNNGRFTVVLGDGKIVKGEDFLRRR